ncbi:MAG: chemotaxis protein CheW [Aliidongia sp.]
MHASAAIGNRGSGTHVDQERWLLCRAGSALCALPLGQVIETMRALPIEAVAGAPRYVRGVAIIRGVPTPVVDIARLFGGPASRAERLVTLKIDTRVIALAVDSVLGIRLLEGIAEPLPPLLGDVANDVVSMIGRLDTELLLYLNTVRLLPQEDWERVSSLEASA